MRSGPERRLRKPGGRLALARGAFLLLAGMSIGLLLLLAPINLRTAEFDWQAEAIYPVLAPFLTRSAYVYYTLTLNYSAALVCVLVGVVIAWRKADDPVAWLAGVMLVSWPISFGLAGYSDTWGFYPSDWRGIFRAAREVTAFASATALVLFVFLFPNGKLPMRWMRWVCLAFMGVMLVLGAGDVVGLEYSFFTDWVFLAWVLSFLIAISLGLAGQYFRYRRVSTPLERQQTKWVVLGITLLVTVFLVDVALQTLASTAMQRGVVLLVMGHLQLLSLVLVPTTLAFSILRYRLWDIDRLIHRSLLYAVLTGALAALYLGSVIVLQSVLRAVTGQGQSPVVTVISTLFIAAAAGPLRTRLQNVIDRRFNRRRYDAARTLAAFGSAMRDNSVADLERLNHQLVGVVQETLEPETVSLWLRS